MNGLLYDVIDVKFKENYKNTGQNTYLKAIITGHIIEVYEYEKMPTLPSQKKKEREKELDLEEVDLSDLNEGEYDNTLNNRQNNMQKARNKLRRLISANFDEGSKFVTLTFAENQKDVKNANYEFMKFIQRLRYRHKNFKYAAVIEFQKRGAVHYHMISDLPFIENSELNKVWGHGFVKINNISHVDNVGAYMIKYMSKDNGDLRLQGLKSYQTSKNLIRPIEFRGDDVEEIMKAYNLDNKKMVFANSYESEHLGLTTYKEYNLKRL